MEIIKHGNPVPEKWWTGRQVKCYMCEAIVVLDENDAVKVTQDRDGDFATFACPDCHGNVHVYKPLKGARLTEAYYNK